LGGPRGPSARGPIRARCYLCDVRRSALVTAWLVLAAAATPARADWQVHRTDPSALLERAERALLERPDDDDVARRLVKLAGRDGRTGLRERFRVRAERAGVDGGRTAYAPLAAYAHLLHALGDAKGAVAAYDQVLRVAPQSVPAIVGRARALTDAGDSAAALAAYDDALKLEHRASARRRLIDASLAILARTGDAADEVTQERTIALLRELARVQPESDEVAARLADALERAGQPTPAAEVLESRLRPGHAAANVDLALRAARLRFASRDPADAARVAATLQSLLRDLPAADAERRRSVWSLAFTVARSRGTLAELARELERAPGPVEWDMLGRVRDALGDLEGALVATRTALAAAPRDVEIGRRLIALHDQLGNEDDATAVMAELVRRLPDDSQLIVDLIERQTRHGHRAEAAAAFDRATTHFANNRGALQQLAALASRTGEDRRALTIWQRLHKLDPGNEGVIIGLGEAQFQAGLKNEARATWATLRERVRPPAHGHLRLAEVLLEHDLASDAIVEAKRAQALEPRSIEPHRMLAQIFEHARKFNEAIGEWNTVLALADRKLPGNEQQAGLRREARVRLLGLLARQGRSRMDAQIRQLRDDVRAHPDDLEVAIFLAEAQQRTGDSAAAIATLKDVLARAAAGAPTDATRDVAVEAGFALVHLLKRTGQLDEAVTRLDEISRIAPGRAREAHLQIADISLARHDVTRALSHASAAAASADPQTLARVGELQARAGADTQAIATFRAAVARDANPAAMLALARLLVRRGDEQEAEDTLDGLLRSSHDDEAITEAGRLALELADLRGRLPELEVEIGDALAAGEDTPARRKLLVALLKRLLPTMYRDEGADDARRALGRRVLRPLLELLTEADQLPDRTVVDLIGMLGNGDAAPALVRLALRAPDGASSRSTRASAATSIELELGMLHGARAIANAQAGIEVQLAALAALARLGDARARPAFVRYIGPNADQRFRALSIWGLGRLSDQPATTELIKALDSRQNNVVAVACLGLGRHPTGAALQPLFALAADPRRPTDMRRAAIIGLGHAAARDTLVRGRVVPALLELLDTGDPQLVQAAAMALAWSRDARALSPLLARALLPRRFALPDASVPLEALAAWQAGAAPLDEARRLGGIQIEVDALLVLPAPTASTDLSPLWRGHTRELQDLLADALARGGEARRDALAALDGRPDGLALGTLTSDADVALAPEVVAATREVVQPIADKIASLLDDPEPDTRAAALRVLAKLGDERVTAARIAAAVIDASPSLANAAAFAAARVTSIRPAQAPAIAAALAPVLGDDGWRRRMAAVDALAAIGPAGVALLERTRADKHAVVRAAAIDALARKSY
jgi:tetratricopeptide (TPR) repeat protein